MKIIGHEDERRWNEERRHQNQTSDSWFKCARCWWRNSGSDTSLWLRQWVSQWGIRSHITGGFPTTYTTRPGSVVAVWTCLSVSPFISHKPLLSVGQVTVGSLMFDSLLSTGDIQTKTLGKIAVLLCSLFVLCTNIFHPLKCYLIGQDLWVPDLLLWLVHHLLVVYIIRKWIIGNIDGCLKVRF